ncbi:SAF domain-containing protein [Georgenia sp. AZ-5]|uniref:SAF domain-containing protein n=1 Tax=Georgenia sp. AZ-5 TaxID=3367526 RepID=UPI0037543401
MRTRQAVPPSRSTRARLRRAVWRRRHLLAALSLGLAAATAVTAVAPPDPPGRRVLVLATDTPAGTALTERHLAVSELPPGAVPPGALADVADAAGSGLAVGLPAGTPLLPGMLVGPGLAAGAPAGTVVVAVPVADPSARLVRPGRRVSLVTTSGDVAGSPGGAEVVARSVVVLAVEAGTAGGAILDTNSQPVSHLYVAASERVATVLVGSGAWAPLRAVLEP